MLFTTPVLSDVGIAMVMVPEVPTMWGKSAELITPFTTDVLKRSNPCRPDPSRAPPREGSAFLQPKTTKRVF